MCKLKRKGREQGIAFNGQVYPIKDAKLINLSREDFNAQLERDSIGILQPADWYWLTGHQQFLCIATNKSMERSTPILFLLSMNRLKRVYVAAGIPSRTMTGDTKHEKRGLDSKGHFHVLCHSASCTVTLFMKNSCRCAWLSENFSTIAVDLIRSHHAMDPLIEGDLKTVVNTLKAAIWTSLSVYSYADVKALFEGFGGVVK